MGAEQPKQGPKEPEKTMKCIWCIKLLEQVK